MAKSVKHSPLEERINSLKVGEPVLVASREEKLWCCHFTWGEYRDVDHLMLGVLKDKPTKNERGFSFTLPMDKYLERVVDRGFVEYGFILDGIYAHYFERSSDELRERKYWENDKYPDRIRYLFEKLRTSWEVRKGSMSTGPLAEKTVIFSGEDEVCDAFMQKGFKKGYEHKARIDLSFVFALHKLRYPMPERVKRELERDAKPLEILRRQIENNILTPIKQHRKNIGELKREAEEVSVFMA